MFRHDWRDSFLLGLSFAGLILPLWLALSFEARSGLSSVLFGALGVAVHCTNYQCIAHNFIHNPFFRSRWVNSVFSVLNSISLGMPQTLYRFHHLNHHKYGNDRKNPQGQTKDRSSTYRHSHRSDEENILSYSLIGPFRMELGLLYRSAVAKGKHRLVHWELTAQIAYALILLSLDSRFFVVWYIPVWFLGQASALAENYLEHHRAQPDCPLADSVSCYNPIYNLLWFNNGYHQEHHVRPSVHWSKIREVRREMIDENERIVVKIAHFTNLF